MKIVFSEHAKQRMDEREIYDDYYNLLLDMKTHYDKKVDAFYISFQNAKKEAIQTVKLKDFLFVDIGKKGKVYGIEILDASSHFPTKRK